jgi:SAM-dependent methyltransferase
LRSLAWRSINCTPPFLRYRAFQHLAEGNLRAASSSRQIDNISTAEWYWSHYRSENRVTLVNYLAKRFDGKQLSILDFGCHCGNTFRLIEETLSAKIEYLGIDPNAENLDFARMKFENSSNQCSFMVGQDRSLASLIQGRHFDFVLVSSVFYAMPPAQVGYVLRAVANCADHIVIADDLSRLEARSCIKTNSFLHPYRKLLLKYGFHIDAIVPFPAPQIAYTGLLVASPAKGLSPVVGH